MFNPDEMVEIKQITLDKIKIACQDVIGNTTLESMRLETLKDYIADGMVVRLQAYVLGTEIAKDSYEVTAKFTFPENWWQHLKEAKAPQWFLRKYPVRYKEHYQHHAVELSRKATYPMANIAVTSNPVMFQNLGAVEVIKDSVSIK